MTENEVKKFLSENGLQPYNLPKILVSDPQAKKLEAKPGQILRIYRTDGGNDYEYFRLVVED